MGVGQAVDITAKERQTVLSLLKRHLPGTAAWVYGSRAKWTSRPQSDLDLVVFATPQQRRQVSNLREDLEESNLPFRVDLFVWDDTPMSFREQIEEEHVVLARSSASAEEWQTVSLGDCTEINEQTYSPKEQWTFVNYLDTGSITKNRISKIQTLIIGKDKLPTRARKKAQIGDIVYSTVRPNQRHFGILKNVPENFLVSTGFAVFRGKKSIVDTGFLYWFLVQDHIVEQLHTLAEHSTSTYPSIKPSDIKRLQVALPSIPEQESIVHILGTLDDKIELNRRMNETLEAMARALFRSWFVDFDPVRAKMEGEGPGLLDYLADLFPDRLVDSELGEIPEGWCNSTLADVATLNPESWSNRNAPDRILYTDLANTKWGYIDTIQEYAWVDAPSRGRRVLRRGDTIVGTVRPENGSFALIDRDGLTGSTGFAVLRPTNATEREFVWCAATSHDAIKRLARLADGGAYPAVRPSAVLDTLVVLPDPRVRIAFSSLSAPLLNRLQENQRESRTLAAIRDTLLPKLISGEIRVRYARRAVESLT